MTPATLTPAELRRFATQARHLGMPGIADALDAAAERIEGLEEYHAANEAIHAASDSYGEQRRMYREGAGRYPSSAPIVRAMRRFRDAREALQEIDPTPTRSTR